ncbi:TATA box-binding protein-associated factor RNA polymerase I subunit A [Puntigrus tetrazona]|uniref:TATA box-binding protein-associated factor RNA polymerase I subunit A n=1 Tax=Puntigrus tetrazona TaxID=1606681 RepID=UPI001C89E843|nr:TATA box-binding protein-associated factor RNA polymerase I subunit A [Puntigrus tetrazona]
MNRTVQSRRQRSGLLSGNTYFLKSGQDEDKKGCVFELSRWRGLRYTFQRKRVSAKQRDMDDIEAVIDIAEEHESVNHEPMRSAVLLHRTLPDDRGLLTSVGFVKSNRRCLSRVREAMLRHNWREAAGYFNSYIQTLQAGTLPQVRSAASEVVWRIGTEILQHLPNSGPDDFNALYEQLKNVGVKNYSKICLEHCFHLLLNKQLDGAKRQLTVADSWRHGKQSAAQSLMKTLIRGYCGYLDYLIWCRKRPSAPGGVTEEAGGNHEMHSYFRQASVTLKEIVGQPGIWDPFVLSYIDMLEFYEDDEAAFGVLENYAYNKDFPLNPNAHVYLYQFVKRHKAPRSKLVGLLRILHSIVPSHELMLELCSLLLKSKKKKNQVEALTVSMDLLEFSSWKCNMKAWRCLLKIMIKLKQKYEKAVRKEWAVRRSLWLSLHYREYTAWRDSLHNASLLVIKRDVLRLAGEGNIQYFKIALSCEREEALRGGERMEREKRKRKRRL